MVFDKLRELGEGLIKRTLLKANPKSEAEKGEGEPPIPKDAASSSGKGEAPSKPEVEGEAEAESQAQTQVESHDLRGKPSKRRLIVIGDLHGDYYRLVRILEEFGLVTYENKANPLSFSWNYPQPISTDLVLVGDYVDWRGERLEGPEEEWIFGTYRILLLLSHLRRALKPQDEAIRLFTLVGNHEDMMLKSFFAYRKLIKELSPEELLEMIDSSNYNFYSVFTKAAAMGISQENLNLLMEFVNWYFQGGRETIYSFGGVNRWLEEMSSGPIRDFLDDLILMLRLDRILIAHSLPDDFGLMERALLQGIDSLSEEEKERLRVQVLWSRGIWGIDAFSNRLIKPPDEGPVRDLLERVGLEKIIVGHTPLNRYRKEGEKSLSPFFVYNGMVVNTDLHGVPNSQPFVEEYEWRDGEVMVVEDKALRRYNG